MVRIRAQGNYYTTSLKKLATNVTETHGKKISFQYQLCAVDPLALRLKQHCLIKGTFLKLGYTIITIPSQVKLYTILLLNISYFKFVGLDLILYSTIRICYNTFQRDVAGL